MTLKVNSIDEICMTTVDGVFFVLQALAVAITILCIPIWAPFWLIGRTLQHWPKEKE